jgi:signal peptidase II
VQEHGARTALTSEAGGGTDVRRRRGAALLAACAFAVVGVDQLTKAWAVSHLDDHDIDLVGSLRFHLERNSGGAFSLNRGRGGIVAVGALLVVVGVIWFGRSMIESRWGAVAVGLVLGGALGNLVDRVLRDGSGFLGGAVVDFIDAQWWPVFNVADIAVTIGGVLLVLVSSRPSREGRPSTE